MEQNQKKLIITHLKVGEHREMREYITENNISLDSKSAIEFVLCCFATFTKSSLQFDSGDMCDFLNYIVDFIEIPSDAQIDNYLRAVFHILKTLIKKGQYEEVYKLEKMLKLKFINSHLTDTQKNIYSSICTSLYTLLYNGKDMKTPSNDTFLEIACMTCKAYKQVFGTRKLLESAYNCALILRSLKFDASILTHFYILILSLLDDAKKEKADQFSEEIVKHLIVFFSFILNNHINCGEIEAAEDFFKKALIINTQKFSSILYTDITELFLVCFFITPIEIRNKEIFCKKRLDYLRNLSSNQVKADICGQILVTIESVIKFHIDQPKRFWETFPLQMQKKFFSFLHELSIIYSTVTFKCPCKCQINKNIIESVKVHVLYLNLLKLTLKVQPTCDWPDGFMDEILKSIEYACNQIKYASEQKCEKWKQAWNQLGIKIYQVIRALSTIEQATCIPFSKMFLKYCICFKAEEEITKSNLLGSTFFIICDAMFNLKYYTDVLAVSALYIFLCPTNREHITSRYFIKSKIILKKEDKEDIRQYLTIPMAITKNLSYLNDLLDTQIEISREDQVKLLIFELEQYKLIWKSKTSIMAAFKQLYDLGGLTTTAKVYCKIMYNFDHSMDENMTTFLHKILVEYDQHLITHPDDVSGLACLGILNYLHYQQTVGDAVAKNCEKVEKANDGIKRAQNNEPPDAIPDEQCDIVSTYESLKLKNYFPTLNFLDKALSLLTGVSIKETDKDYLPLLLHGFKSIAIAYRLHGLRIPSLQALELILKLPKDVRTSKETLLAISLIIESSDVTKEYIRKLIIEGNGLAMEMENEKEHVDIVITFYICKSKAYFHHDYNEAYLMYEKAQLLFNSECKAKEMLLIEAQLLVLHFKFINLPCNLRVVDHKKNTAYKLCLALKLLKEKCSSAFKQVHYEISILLQINEDLIKIYHQLRMPREVRCVCHFPTLITQKLNLPFRCFTNLFYLAFADLKTSHKDDCNDKLSGLTDILCLPKTNMPEIIADVKEIEPAPIKEEVNNLAYQMQEMVLDLPVKLNSYKKEYAPGSPVFTLSTFKFPHFLQHGSSCECFYCTCVEYQICAIAQTHISAVVNIYQNNPAIAQDFFNGALQMYHNFTTKFPNYRLKMERNIATDLVCGVEAFTEVYCSTLLDYSRFLITVGNQTKALKINVIVLEHLEKNKLKHNYLYIETVLQRLSFIVKLPTISNCNQLEFNDEKPSNDLSKTPESKSSKITIKVENCPADRSPEERQRMKVPVFSLSPSDTESSSETATASSTARTSKSTMKKKKAPLFLMPNIGTPVNTPCAQVQKSGLKTRTRLLTDKLKNSSCKKPEAQLTAGSSKNDNSKPVNSSTRKNLFCEVDKGTSKGNNEEGTVRRSARNLK